MTRLPNINGDDNNWGVILNDFLKVSHTSTGTLNPGVVGNSQLDSSTQSILASVASKYVMPSSGLPLSLLPSSIPLSNLATTGSASSSTYLRGDGTWGSLSGAYVPIELTAVGPPTTGTWPAGQSVVDANGITWNTVAGGSPGSWTKAMSPFVQRKGTQLYLEGQPFTFLGFNFPNFAINYTDASGGGFETSLASIVATGGAPNVMRIWWFQQYVVSGGALNFTVLDSALAVLKSYGMRAIITLASNGYGDGSLNNAWYSSGYATNTASPLVTTYRDYVQAIVTRYADNPTVMVWQLVNEATPGPSDLGANELTYYNTMQAFVNDVGAMVKSIDQNHLLSLGNIIGFDGGNQWGGSAQEHFPPTTPTPGKDDYQLLLTNPYLDIADYHDYGEPTIPLSTTGGLGIAKTLSVTAAVGKPLMIAETGIDWTSSPTYNPEISPPTIAERATLFQAKFQAYLSSGIVGACVWDWNNNPTTFNGPDYALEVGPSDPVLPMMNPNFYDQASTVPMLNPLTTAGDIMYENTTPARLPIGSTGQVLTVASGLPSWATPASLTGAATIQFLTTAASATPSIAVGTYNQTTSTIAGLSTAITGVTVTGTLVDGQVLVIRLTDNGTQQGITLGSQFEASPGVPTLPTTTQTSVLMTIISQYNAVTSKFRVLGVV